MKGIQHFFKVRDKHKLTALGLFETYYIKNFSKNNHYDDSYYDGVLTNNFRIIDVIINGDIVTFIIEETNAQK